MKLLFFQCLNEVHRLNFVACRKKKMLWLKEYMHYHDISQILFLICIFTIYRDLDAFIMINQTLKVNYRVARLLALAHNSCINFT